MLTSLFGCNQDIYDDLLGDDFKLFDNTELEPLTESVAKQDVLQIRRILSKKNIDVNFQEKKFGNTLLMLATSNNLNSSVLELLKGGADPNIRDFELNESALDDACSKNQYICNVQNVKSLIKFGAKINAVQKAEVKKGLYFINTPLTIAAKSGCLDIVKILVKEGADIDLYTYYDGYGAITEAIIHDHLDIAKYLIVECRSNVSKVCYIRSFGKANQTKLSLVDLLNESEYKINDPNYQFKKEILEYLKGRDSE